MATTTTLLKLPAQPVPPGNVIDGAFVTIWFVFTTVFALALSWQLRIPRITTALGWLFRSNPREAKEIFREVCLATVILAFWYFFLMVDRWIHHVDQGKQVSVGYGYIVFLTLIDALRVLSAVIFAWGNYKIVWVEIEIWFNEARQARLWLAAKIALFLVSLVSIYYAVLYLALAGVWLGFGSLNSIADIATKRTHFEIATAALLTVFAGFALGAAVYALVVEARRVDGEGNKAWRSRWLLLAATFIFFLRSLIEWALLLRILTPEATRGSLTLARDISYGLLSCIYLGAITVYAPMVSAPDDTRRVDTRDIKANVRRYIDRKLNAETEDARKTARPFLDIMEEVEDAYKNDTDGIRAAFHAGSALPDEVNSRTIETYFATLRRNFGHLGSEEQLEPAVTSPSQSTTSLFSTIGQRVFGAASDPNMRSTSRKRSGWSLFSDFQTASGRNSAPPTMPASNDEPDGNLNNQDIFDTSDTVSEWTRTEILSRRGSVARSHRNFSAPTRNRPMETHFEEMPGSTSRGGHDSRIVTDPTARHAAQRWELGETEPLSPQELGHEQPRRPAHPLAPSQRSIRRQRPAHYAAQRSDVGYEMGPYQAYTPHLPSSFGPLNTYAERHRAARREQTGSEVGVPGTPFLQQASPRPTEAQVNRRYTATPDQAQHEQPFIPAVTETQVGDVPGGPPPPDTAPTATPDATEPAVGRTAPARPTMRFQVAGRNRRPVGAEGSSSPGVNSGA